MLTIREAQQKTGLSYATINRSVVEGKIRSVKQGNKYLVYEEDLRLLPKPRNTGIQQHLQAETVEVPQEPPFPSALTGAQMVELKKWETLQMMLRIAS